MSEACHFCDGANDEYGLDGFGHPAERVVETERDVGDDGGQRDADKQETSGGPKSFQRGHGEVHDRQREQVPRSCEDEERAVDRRTLIELCADER